jgi:hypothetical protein
VARDPRPASRRKGVQVGLEPLEDRVIPAVTMFAGLEFQTAGAFAVHGHTVTATTPVKVGAKPLHGVFTPLFQLDRGVRFQNNDRTGRFTTPGTVMAFVGKRAVRILDQHQHTLTAAGLLGHNGMSLPVVDKNLAKLPVAGAAFTVTNLHAIGKELDLQGTLAVPALSGLTLPVTGPNHIAVDQSGARLTSLDVNLSPGTIFSVAGLPLSV